MKTCTDPIDHAIYLDIFFWFAINILRSVNCLNFIDWNDNLAFIFEPKLTSIVFVGGVDTILPRMYRDLMFSLVIN